MPDVAFTGTRDWPISIPQLFIAKIDLIGDIMNESDIEEYRTELENADDETLFGESELTQLAETRMNALVEKYEEELDAMDMSELYGDALWEELRATRIEERIEARLETFNDVSE